MTTIRLCDTLRVEVSPGENGITLDLETASPQAAGVPTDGSNLIIQALEALRREAGVERGARVSLTKRIPSQAGLGGGSSDAAAALLAGNRVWGINWPIERLAELSSRLGSDIPFFVHSCGSDRPQAAVATGRGEKVAPIEHALRGQPVVVVKPDAGLSTAQVFGQCEPADYEFNGVDRCQSVAEALAKGDLRALSRGLTNGLQAAAMRFAPWLGAVRESFESAGFAVHQLSGSGSAYFGLTRTHSEARRLAARLRALRVGQTYATAFG